MSCSISVCRSDRRKWVLADLNEYVIQFWMQLVQSAERSWDVSAVFETSQLEMMSWLTSFVGFLDDWISERISRQESSNLIDSNPEFRMSTKKNKKKKAMSVLAPWKVSGKSSAQLPVLRDFPISVSVTAPGKADVSVCSLFVRGGFSLNQ